MGGTCGDTPIDLPDLSPGVYRINISLREYVPSSGLYTLSAGQTKQISVKLDPPSSFATLPTPPMTEFPESGETSVPVSPTRAPLSDIMVLSGILTGVTVTIRFFRR